MKNTIAAGATLTSLKALGEQLPENGAIMPCLFIGHGSPMNAIESNEFVLNWKKITAKIPVPKAILCVSAHWLTRGTFVMGNPEPKTIYDFGGFPQALFDVKYAAKGSVDLALQTKELLKNTNVELNHDWGYDHGSWSVTNQMYPEAKIPMIQLSIDFYKGGQYHYELGQQLASLRKKGVLILGSGNMIHNLGMISMPAGGNFNSNFGFDWALEINTLMNMHLHSGNHAALYNYQNMHKNINLAIPTPDHYFPLLYILGLQDKKDNIEIFNDKCVAGSLNMTSVLIGA